MSVLVAWFMVSASIESMRSARRALRVLACIRDHVADLMDALR